MYATALDHAIGNAIDESKGRRIPVMCWKLMWVRQNEKCSRETEKELETGECKLWMGRRIGGGEIA